MACILHIETSTNVCSVALTDEGVCLDEWVCADGPSHATVLGGYVRSALSFADSHALPLCAVALSQGPGSYTGLRIGSSMAKGVCFGRNVPLMAIPTLEVMCVPVLLEMDTLEDNALLCPMIDARRMEVYTALFDKSLRPIRKTSAVVVDSASFLEKETGDRPVYFFGNGAEKCREVLSSPRFHFLEGISPLAKNMLPLAERSYAKENFENMAYFEPYYLKDFIATIPKKAL